MFNLRLIMITAGTTLAGACSTGPQVFNDGAPVVMPKMETAPVASRDDAADDPAFFFNAAAPEKSFILGTNKKAGLYLYSLQGNDVQFLPVGNVNNVDLRYANEELAIAVATNRTDNTLSIFSVTAEGATFLDGFPTVRQEPYGLCLGQIEDAYFAVVPNKTGDADFYRIDGFGTGKISSTFLMTEKFDSQLEGCVFDEALNALYVGEENAGLYRLDILPGSTPGTLELANRRMVDRVGSETGIVADIEGVTLYPTGPQTGYVIASSQGNNSYAVYDRETNAFLGRFRIGTDEARGIDGAEETDGIDATAVALPGYPKGLFIAQDGYNKPTGSTQNFKVVDWRDIEAALNLSK